MKNSNEPCYVTIICEEGQPPSTYESVVYESRNDFQIGDLVTLVNVTDDRLNPKTYRVIGYYFSKGTISVTVTTDGKYHNFLPNMLEKKL